MISEKCNFLYLTIMKIMAHEFMRHEFMDSKSMNSRGNSRVTHASPTAGSHHEPTASELSRSYGHFRFAHAFDAVWKGSES